MKQTFFLLCFCLGLTNAFSQSEIKLIIRSDDMGFAHSGNTAIRDTYKNGITTSIEVIVPSPWFPEAVKMLDEMPDVDVGIHLALTSEWDNVKWRPLTDCPTLQDEDGYFFPMVWPNKNYPGRAIMDRPVSIKDVEQEFRAQIELALKKLPRISHVSGHMGCTHMNNEVKALTVKLAKEYGIHIDLVAKGVKNVTYQGSSNTFAEKKNSFLSMLQSLTSGTYMFVDHPAIDDAEMRAIHHIGYENVAEDRQGVTDLLQDAEVIAVIKQRKIQLVSYKDLVTK